jgi:hypothetical protein
MFDDNTSSGIINGYNHDGTMMAGWPVSVTGSSFFCNPFVFDVEGNGTLNISANSYDYNSLKTFLYLWETEVAFNQDLAILPVLGYNVRHTGVYGEYYNPTVLINESDSQDIFSVNCSPNPCREQTLVYFQSDKTGQVDILLIDSKGAVVKKINSDILETGIQNFGFNTSDLQPGVYNILVNHNTETGNCKLIKL